MSDKSTTGSLLDLLGGELSTDMYLDFSNGTAGLDWLHPSTSTSINARSDQQPSQHNQTDLHNNFVSEGTTAQGPPQQLQQSNATHACAPGHASTAPANCMDQRNGTAGLDWLHPCTSTSIDAGSDQQPSQYNQTEVQQHNNFVIEGTSAQGPPQQLQQTNATQACAPGHASTAPANRMDQSNPSESVWNPKEFSILNSDDYVSSTYLQSYNGESTYITQQNPHHDNQERIVQKSTQQGSNPTGFQDNILRQTGHQDQYGNESGLMLTNYLNQNAPAEFDWQQQNVPTAINAVGNQQSYMPTANLHTGNKPFGATNASSTTTTNTTARVATFANESHAPQVPTKPVPQRTGAQSSVDKQKQNPIEVIITTDRSAPQSNYTQGLSGANNQQQDIHGAGNAHMNSMPKLKKVTVPASAVLVGAPQSVSVKAKSPTNNRLSTNERMVRQLGGEPSQAGAGASQRQTADFRSPAGNMQRDLGSNPAEKEDQTVLDHYLKCTGNTGPINVEITTDSPNQQKSILRVIDPVDKSSKKGNSIMDWTSYLTNNSNDNNPQEELNNPEKDNHHNIKNIGEPVSQPPPESSVQRVEIISSTPAGVERNSTAACDPVQRYGQMVQSNITQNVAPIRSNRRPYSMGFSTVEAITNTHSPQRIMTEKQYYAGNRPQVTINGNARRTGRNVQLTTNHFRAVTHQPKTPINAVKQVRANLSNATANAAKANRILQLGKACPPNLQYNRLPNGRAVAGRGRKMELERHTAIGYRVPHIDLSSGREYPNGVIQGQSVYPPPKVVEVLYGGKGATQPQRQVQGNPTATTGGIVSTEFRQTQAARAGNNQQLIDVHAKPNPNAMYDPKARLPKLNQKNQMANPMETRPLYPPHPNVRAIRPNTANPMQPTVGMIPPAPRQIRVPHLPNQCLPNMPNSNGKRPAVRYNYQATNNFIIENAEYYKPIGGIYADRDRPLICMDPCPVVGEDNKCKRRCRTTNKNGNARPATGRAPAVASSAKATTNNKPQAAPAVDQPSSNTNTPVVMHQVAQTFNENGQLISAAPYYSALPAPQSETCGGKIRTNTRMNNGAQQQQQVNEHVFKRPRTPKAKKDKGRGRGRPYARN